jgi:hypothetical protein
MAGKAVDNLEKIRGMTMPMASARRVNPAKPLTKALRRFTSSKNKLMLKPLTEYFRCGNCFTDPWFLGKIRISMSLLLISLGRLTMAEILD